MPGHWLVAGKRTEIRTHDIDKPSQLHSRAISSSAKSVMGSFGETVNTLRKGYDYSKVALQCSKN